MAFLIDIVLPECQRCRDHEAETVLFSKEKKVVGLFCSRCGAKEVQWLMEEEERDGPSQ